MRLNDPDNPLATEIRHEAAEAYFAACKKMVDLLAALKEFDSKASAVTRNDEQIRRRTELIEDAAERVHFVIIQREAMKLSWTEQFFEDYGIPPEVKARLGTWRQK